MSETRQLCTFRLDDLFLGVDVEQVQEVIRHQPMTKVPIASSTVRGLINLRGQIVTAVDLRCRFGLPARENEEPPMNVVLRRGEGAVAFLVDEIGDVLEVTDEDFEPPPSTLQGTVRHLVAGVFKLDGELLLVLDTDRTLTGMSTAA